MQLVLILTLQSLRAGSATWKLDPRNDSWNFSTDWTPETVPDGPDDIASFTTSDQTEVTVYDNTEVNSIAFNRGASAFTIFNGYGFQLHNSLTISGAGIINTSGIMQNFYTGQVDTSGNSTPDTIYFTNGATAGELTEFTVDGTDIDDWWGGRLYFQDTSTAGSALIKNHGAAVYEGDTFFDDSSSAGTATILNGASVSYYDGAVFFYGTSTGGNATIINHGPMVPGGSGGMVYFRDTSSAGSSTIICEGAKAGRTVSAGVSFLDESNGDKARIRLFGDGELGTAGHSASKVTIGSLEGDGIVFVASISIGPVLLRIGNNNLSTTFSGNIIDDDLGSIGKIGSGTLILTGSNSYSAGTIVEAGQLLINNTRGSGTGSGEVEVKAGTLGGDGVIDGPVFVGTESGTAAKLAPGKTSSTPGDFTIRTKLTLLLDATYEVTLDSDAVTADSVKAGGAGIRDARIMLVDLAANVLPPDTTFTIINNTSPKPISGTFSNLPDGSSVTIGNNTFQANYEGGDGNDLTLTVVP